MHLEIELLWHCVGFGVRCRLDLDLDLALTGTETWFESCAEIELFRCVAVLYLAAACNVSFGKTKHRWLLVWIILICSSISKLWFRLSSENVRTRLFHQPPTLTSSPSHPHTRNHPPSCFGREGFLLDFHTLSAVLVFPLLTSPRFGAQLQPTPTRSVAGSLRSSGLLHHGLGEAQAVQQLAGPRLEGGGVHLVQLVTDHLRRKMLIYIYICIYIYIYICFFFLSGGARRSGVFDKLFP